MPDTIQESKTQTGAQPIVLTEGAIVQLRKIMTEQDVPSDYGLRVGVKGGGCSGFSYVLGFDQKTDKDQEYLVDGFPVFIDRSQGMYLIGMEVDWHEGLNNRGFVFNNPNATDTCGCGSSFSA
jgi:iron-sulfur cluster assembly protein